MINLAVVLACRDAKALVLPDSIRGHGNVHVRGKCI
jgi:hypothetical protein